VDWKRKSGIMEGAGGWKLGDVIDYFSSEMEKEFEL
jgi:hypothetical protein